MKRLQVLIYRHIDICDGDGEGMTQNPTSDDDKDRPFRGEAEAGLTQCFCSDMVLAVGEVVLLDILG